VKVYERGRWNLKREFLKNQEHLYMILEGQKKDDFQIDMQCYNHIAGVLPMHYYTVDDKNRYYYDISRKKTIQELGGYEKYNLQDMKNLLTGLYLCTEKLEEYLLDMNQILFYQDVIYQDVKTGEIFFCLYPDSGESLMNSLQQFIENWIAKVDYKDKELIAILYALENQLSEPYCTIKDLLDCCMNEEVEISSVEKDHEQTVSDSTSVSEVTNLEDDRTHRKNLHTLSMGGAVMAIGVIICTLIFFVL
jgi:hypothetical protein